MQEQDPSSTGHIEQAWCVSMLLCLIGDGLDIKSRAKVSEWVR
jgi:glycogen debranching enzyme